MIDWFGRAGIELTFQPASVKCEGQIEDFPYSSAASVIEAYLVAKKGESWFRRWVYNCGFDPTCVEISTTVLSSWKEMRCVVGTITEAAAKVGFIPKHPKFVGGGGHIHFSYADDTSHLLGECCLFGLLRSTYDRPWLTWAFEDPSDDINSMPLVCSKRYLPLTAKLSLGLLRNLYGSEQFGTKDHAMRRINTPVNARTEFRFFDMPKTWKQHEEHMAFVMAYAGWVYRRVMAGNQLDTTLKLAKAKKLTVSESKSQFLAFIKQLGLPVSRYRKYTRNIDDRFELGTCFSNGN